MNKIESYTTLLCALNCKTGPGKLPRTGFFSAIKAWQLVDITSSLAPPSARPPRGATGANRKGQDKPKQIQFTLAEIEALYYLASRYFNHELKEAGLSESECFNLRIKLLNYQDYS